jgi:hypothetical protein
VWEVASSPAHHIRKKNTINKPHDAPWCATNGTLPRRGKECDVECVLDRTWKIFSVSEMQHSAVYWVLFQALLSEFAFVRVYGSSLQKSVINWGFILPIFSYAYGHRENRGCDSKDVTARMWQQGCDSTHKPQELHHYVVIKNYYTKSNTIAVYLNICNALQFFIIYAAPLRELIFWHICNRKSQKFTYLYVMYALPSNFHM